MNSFQARNQFSPAMSPIKQIEILASKIPGSISLAQGIPSFETPVVIKNEIIKATNSSKVSKYSLNYGLPELRMLISDDLKKNNMCYNWEKEIIVTCGAAQGIAATLLAIITSNKNEVIVPCPSYASYPRMINLAKGKVIFSKMQKNWNLDIEDIKNKINNRTSAIILANPNNPTGNIFKKEELKELANIAIENNIYIILDEVYKDFTYKDEEFYSLAQESRYKNNIIRVFSFSKAYAMTGWRVGYINSNEKIIKNIIGAHDALITCAPVVSQYGAMAALKYGKEDQLKFKEILNKRRIDTFKYLKGISLFDDVVIPDAGYFFFPRVSKEKNVDSFVLKLLKNKKIALVPGSAFGPGGEDRIRICFGQEQNLINKALNIINNSCL
jgi:aminotransferase